LRSILLHYRIAGPDGYLRYPEERQYDHFIVGEDHVDYRAALELLSERYGIRRVLAGNATPHVFFAIGTPWRRCQAEPRPQ